MSDSSATIRTEQQADSTAGDNSLGELARIQAISVALEIALKETLDRYCDLVNSGDCGFWDAEAEDHVKKARAAIAKAEGR